MNKAELAGVIADKVGVTKKQAEDMLECLTSTVTETIKSGGEVTLTGFGTFSARVRKGREGVNPQNPSQPITIPPTKVVKFKAGKTLKDALKASQHAEAPAAPVEETVNEPVDESSDVM
ncbi:HU family DNA-binding protein [Candidatus Falkowbacteria bacterium]|jgi:DNA-binding protein HU-beta|nr:HU family DNA-binding protein [Candidatus Falkowbacteria bacterium]MBT5503037.1 HU family DNA-binding protein [Candidatus Falkowbacteria bacterium]MBT6574144.1 HU family DNA-binding protein [Candidatus Falkowbacteria bacterium]MBT7348709.1 HU family DNA-binding protein [Candidatus Falkowbacteria bacterium]MBT7500499.1 HU family DNA-binding protein [Candidatus Falkowbacteria bacterium]